MNRVELDASDAAELAESFHRSVGVDAYDLADLRTDLARFHVPAQPRRRRTVLWQQQMTHFPAGPGTDRGHVTVAARFPRVSGLRDALRSR